MLSKICSWKMGHNISDSLFCRRMLMKMYCVKMRKWLEYSKGMACKINLWQWQIQLYF